jgi:hypothetical protein
MATGILLSADLRRLFLSRAFGAPLTASASKTSVHPPERDLNAGTQAFYEMPALKDKTPGSRLASLHARRPGRAEEGNLRHQSVPGLDPGHLRPSADKQ